MPSETVVYRREVLYGEVWSEPATTVAERYGISSVALAKVCKRLHVPVPTRGYWVRRDFGKHDPVPALPALPPGAEAELVITRRRRVLETGRKKAAACEGKQKAGPPIIVPATLQGAHPLVDRARPLFDAAEVKNGRLIAMEPCVDVVTSPVLLDRALRIMSGLLFALEQRGLAVQLDSKGATCVLLHQMWLRFGIAERLRRQWPKAKNPPKNLQGSDREWWLYWNRPRMQLVPSGKLVLEIKEIDVGVRVSWRDESRPIEGRLNDFVKGLFVVAEAKRATSEADALWRAQFEKDAELEQSMRSRAEREARRVAKVRRMLGRWREARDIRQLVREIRDARNVEGGALPRWIAWAERFAQQVDPVTAPSSHRRRLVREN